MIYQTSVFQQCCAASVVLCKDVGLLDIGFLHITGWRLLKKFFLIDALPCCSIFVSYIVSAYEIIPKPFKHTLTG